MGQPKPAPLRPSLLSMILKPYMLLLVIVVFVILLPIYKYQIRPIIIQSSYTEVVNKKTPYLTITEEDIPLFKEFAKPINLKTERVLYNRVPKCGSSAILEGFHWLGLLNSYQFQRSSYYMDFRLDDYYLREFVERFMNVSPPVIYERHIHFVNFTKFGYPQPVYINLIRDPIDRMVSWYYFRRYQEGHEREMSDSKRAMTFDDCVLTNQSECMEPKGWHPEEGYFNIIPFFCGQDEFCEHPTERALQQAMDNVRQYYLVVGYMEELNRFVEALQFLLPSFFYRSTKVFDILHVGHMTDTFRSAYKLPASREARAALRPKLKLEYKFYYFIHRRFRKLMDLIDKIRLQRLDLSGSDHNGKLNEKVDSS